MLSLKDFVKESLSQVTEAILEFDNEYRDKGASANPVLDSHQYGKEGLLAGPRRDERDRNDTITMIDFDVAVTAGDKETAGGKVGINVIQAVFSAEAKAETENQNLNASRVRLRLPLRLPDTGDTGVEPNRDARIDAEIRQSQSDYDPHGY